MREDRSAIAWYVKLDEPLATTLASRSRLTQVDLRDLAKGADPLMRGARRRLAKVLLAHCAGIHPDEVRISRNAAGAPEVLHPPGWYLSLAGRWPHCLIGVALQPFGVDVEPVEAPGPPEDALTIAERLWLHDRRETEAIKLWVLKEAHAKCLGAASRIAPQEVEVRLEDADAGEEQRGFGNSQGGSTLCRLRRIGGTWQAAALRRATAVLSARRENVPVRVQIDPLHIG